jgi:hypothetical protein
VVEERQPRAASDEQRTREPISSITGAYAGHPRHRRPDVPDRARRGPRPPDSERARLLRLDGAGHGVYGAGWETIIAANLELT